MYLGMVFILFGIAILMGSVTPMIPVVGFAVALDRVFVCAEERMLEERFGSVWLEYKGRVRRWL
jgi:protein-S-isoprenylcysteine O-methyltransferase Ste14